MTVASPQPFPFQDRSNPSIHRGSIAVVDNASVDLGIGHDNYDVIAVPTTVDVTAGTQTQATAAAALLAALSNTPMVGVAKDPSKKGRFLLQIKEAANLAQVDGSFVAPTTPSTQATGASGALAVRVNGEHILAQVDGAVFDQAASNDQSVFSGTTLIQIGQSVVFTAVVKNSTGTAAGVTSLVWVAGTAATTGSQVPPTDAQIQTAVGAGATFQRVTNVTVNRTADTVLTQSQDNSARWAPRKSTKSTLIRFIAIANSSVI